MITIRSLKKYENGAPCNICGEYENVNVLAIRCKYGGGYDIFVCRNCRQKITEAIKAHDL